MPTRPVTPFIAASTGTRDVEGRATRSSRDRGDVATIAIGDIHGNLGALTDLLGRLGPEVGSGDTVVFLGDYIDRGPDSKGCVDAILRFRDSASAAVVCLLGNHEEWMLRTLHDHGRHSWLLGMDGFDTIASYSGEAERHLRKAASQAGMQLYLGRCELPYGLFVDAMPRDHRQFFESLVAFHQTPDCVCTHGGLDPAGGPVHEQATKDLVWGTAAFPHAYRGAETVVYGHWNNAVLDPDGWPAPAISGATIGIDTIAHGVLTAMRLPDRRVVQSDRYGV